MVTIILRNISKEFRIYLLPEPQSMLPCLASVFGYSGDRVWVQRASVPPPYDKPLSTC
jgi:hypothetical protein